MKKTGTFRKSGGNPRKPQNRQGNAPGRNQNQSQGQNTGKRKGGIHPWVSSGPSSSQALTSHISMASKNSSGSSNNRKPQNSKNPYRQKRNNTGNPTGPSGEKPSYLERERGPRSVLKTPSAWGLHARIPQRPIQHGIVDSIRQETQAGVLREARAPGLPGVGPAPLVVLGPARRHVIQLFGHARRSLHVAAGGLGLLHSLAAWTARTRAVGATAARYRKAVPARPARDSRSRARRRGTILVPGGRRGRLAPVLQHQYQPRRRTALPGAQP